MTDNPTEHRALVLMPTEAEAYSYWPIVAHIDFDTLPEGSKFYRATTTLDEILGNVQKEPDCFMWGSDEHVQLISCSRIKNWSVAVVSTYTQELAERLVRVQRDRLMSGLHPSYWCVAEPVVHAEDAS